MIFVKKRDRDPSPRFEAIRRRCYASEAIQKSQNKIFPSTLPLRHPRRINQVGGGRGREEYLECFELYFGVKNIAA